MRGPADGGAERDLAALVARWGGDPATLAPLRRGESAVYHFRSGGAGRILRVTADAHRTRAAIEAELAFVDFAAARGLSVARAVPASSGDRVAGVTDGGGERFHAVAFEEMPGRHFAYRSPDVDRPLFTRWGRTMGALHAASREFHPPAERRRHAWHEDPVMRCAADRLPASEGAARREGELVHAWLAARPATAEGFGLIHGDFERTNFLLDGERLHLFDFDDACYHWYLADVAHALWAFRGAPPDERRRFLAWMLEGYREHAPVPDDAAEALSWLVRMRSLALFVHHRLGTGGADPGWAERMRAGFETPFRW